MKNRILGSAVFLVLILAWQTARAVVYTDTPGDTFTTHGGGILDITSVEVHNTATELVFKINLAGNPVATDWGKYMIAIETRAPAAIPSAMDGRGPSA